MRTAGRSCSSRQGAPALRWQPSKAVQARPQSDLPLSSLNGTLDSLQHIISLKRAAAALNDKGAPSLDSAQSHNEYDWDKTQQQQQQQQHNHQYVVQQQRLREQQRVQKRMQVFAGEQARQLTALITSAADVTQLLDVVGQHTQQLDCIHVSAAVKQACRVLGLDLTLPGQQSVQQQSQQQQQQQRSISQQQADTLHSLQQLQFGDVQLRLEQLRTLQQRDDGNDASPDKQLMLQAVEDLHQQQQQPHWLEGMGWDTNIQQQPLLQRVVQQQLEPRAMLQQQLSSAYDTAQHQQQYHHECHDHHSSKQQQQQQQQQESQQDDHSVGDVLPPDSWLLLLLLSRLVTQHTSSMASQQLCTCLNGLTHLLLTHPSLPLMGQPLYRSALQQLLQAAAQQMHRFDARALSVLLHSAAAITRAPLGLAPSPRFMQRWYACSREVLGQASPLDLAMSGWALGRLGAYPPSQWSAEFLAYSKAAIPALRSQELLLLLLGVAETERVQRCSTTATAARAGWVPAAAQQLQAQLPSLTPQQLSGAVLAFAKLQYQPSQEWLTAFARAWESQQGQFTATGHSMVLWGVGAMGQAQEGCQQDRSVWARKLQAALQQAVNRAATAVAAVALLKLRQQQQQQQQGLQQGQDQTTQPQQAQEQVAQQRQQQQHPQVEGGTLAPVNQDQQQQQQQLSTPALVQQPQQQAAIVLEEQPQLLSSASLLHPRDCAMVIYALARLGPACITPDFASFWLRQARSQLGNMNSHELASCLWALGRLGMRPPEEWLKQHLAATAQLAPCMTHQELSMLVWGLAKLQFVPDVFVAAELLMSAAEQLPRFSTHSLALMLYSLGQMHLKPNKEWMALVLRYARYRFRRFDAQDFCGLLVGLYRLRYNPGQQWLDLYAQSLAAKVHLLPANKHALIVTVLRAMGYSGQGRPFAWIMDEAAVAAICNRGGSSRTGGAASDDSGDVQIQ